MLTRMAQESGIETPAMDDLVRLDRKRKGKKLSNEDWTSRTDPDAKIAKMKDGSTHLAYKPDPRSAMRFWKMRRLSPEWDFPPILGGTTAASFSGD